MSDLVGGNTTREKLARFLYSLHPFTPLSHNTRTWETLHENRKDAFLRDADAILASGLLRVDPEPPADEWRAFCRAIGYKIPETGELAKVADVVAKVKEWEQDSRDLWELQKELAGLSARRATPSAVADAIAKVRDIHRAIETKADGQPFGLYCWECGSLPEIGIPYPCPTIEALDGNQVDEESVSDSIPRFRVSFK